MTGCLRAPAPSAGAPPERSPAIPHTNPPSPATEQVSGSVTSPPTPRARATRSTRSVPGSRRSSGTRVSTNSSPVVRVATYRRASTDEENQPFSLASQRSKLDAYVASQDNMAVACDYEEYASAKDIEGRPQLLRLLEDAAAGKFDTVVVHKVDRWSRRLADLLATVEFLDRHGVAFASATEPIDTTTPLGRMVLQILGSFAEFERGLIVERVTRGIEAKLAQGLPLASVGYGLTKDAAGVVIKEPDTFGVVERIFREYTNDRLGTKAIAMGLQADGLPTPGGRPWSAPAVARVLRNRTFIGELPFRDGWVEGAHGPLLNPDLFAAAQRIADGRSAPAAAASARADFVLAGTVVCGHCDAAYVGNTGTSRNKTKVRYYTCLTARRYGKNECAAPSLPADDLERLVGEALVDLYADSGLFEEAVENYLAEQQAGADPLQAELDAAQAAVTDKERVIARYQADYETGKLDADLYNGRTRELRAGVEAASERIAQLHIQLAEAQAAPVPSDDDRRRLHELLAERVHTGPVPVRKALFTALVARLEVHDIDDVRPTFRLGGPELPELADAASPGDASESNPDPEARDSGPASRGQVFACHSSEWS